jgi:hypothetical protein
MHPEWIPYLSHADRNLRADDVANGRGFGTHGDLKLLSCFFVRLNLLAELELLCYEIIRILFGLDSRI